MELGEIISRLESKTEQVVNYFYQGKAAEGYNILEEALGYLLKLIELLEKDEILRLENEDTIIGLKQTLQQTVAAMEAKDIILLADVLQVGILGVSGTYTEQLSPEECFEENKIALEKYDRETYERYQKWNREAKLNINRIEAADGGLDIELEKEGISYSLNSRNCPQKEAKAWCEQFDFSNQQQTMLLFGLGNTMIVRALRETAPENMRLMVYEPSIEIFDTLMHGIRLSDVLAKEELFLLVKGLNEEKLPGVLETVIEEESMAAMIYAAHPQYDKLFLQEYIEYNKAIKYSIMLKQEQINTRKQLGKKVVQNVISLLAYLDKAQFLKQYCGKINGNVPAIIVAAGPSLDLNVGELKEAKGKAVIIATDTAVRTMLKYQILPDFIMTIDPRKPEEYLADPRCKNIPLICLDQANREIIKQHKGVKILYSLQTYMEYLRPADVAKEIGYGIGASVATAAFSACLELGFQTIILIGQDLAYRDGNTHAGGCKPGEEQLDDWQMEVENIYGDKIKIRNDWYIFLEWYEDALATVAKDITVIDATEGGAKIHGTKIMPLKDTIIEYCKEKIDIKRLTEEIDFPFAAEGYAQVVEFMRKSIKDNDKIYEDTKILILKIEELISMEEKKRYNKTYNQLTKDIARLEERIVRRPIQECLELWMAEKEEHGGENSYAMLLKKYKNLHTASKEVRLLLLETYNIMIKMENER